MIRLEKKIIKSRKMRGLQLKKRIEKTIYNLRKCLKKNQPTIQNDTRGEDPLIEIIDEPATKKFNELEEQVLAA